MKLDDLIPDLDVLLVMAPEELAPFVLRLGAAIGRTPNTFNIVDILDPAPAPGGFNPGPAYRGLRRGEVEIAVREAMQWLASQVLTMPTDQPWYQITRRGSALLEDGKFASYVQATAFPKLLLHRSIADDVWLALARGDFPVAVLVAFRAVEEAVRVAAGYGAESYGVSMMRDAFNPKTGPLTRGTDPYAEREGLSALFAGSIGSYKNPHSHRTVTISERSEAQEMVLLASHLLRIVDDRTPRK